MSLQNSKAWAFASNIILLAVFGGLLYWLRWSSRINELYLVAQGTDRGPFIPYNSGNYLLAGLIVVQILVEFFLWIAALLPRDW